MSPDMSNIVPLHPKKLAEIRKMLYEITPDMVERGVVAYHNHLAMGPMLVHDERLIVAILEAALGGDG